MTDTLALDLEELVTGKGWQWLQAWSEKHWSDTAMLRTLETIAARTDLTDDAKARLQEQAFAGRRAVRGLFLAPQEEINRLRAAARPMEQDFSRRGPL